MVEQECGMSPVMDDVRVAALARMPRLLVACDYDGTIAPIVDDPMKAVPRRDTVVAMRTLAQLPQTDVAVVSGRALRDLAALSRLPDEIRLVGSHGGEFDVDFAGALTSEQAEVRNLMSAEAERIARAHGGIVERKPTGVAIHLGSLPPAHRASVAAQLVEGPGEHDMVSVRVGRSVVDLSVVETDKGRALDELRRQVGASVVLYLGDDRTDEDAFETLRGPDVGIKIGDDDTAAALRLADPEQVARLLAHLAEARSDWLMGSGAAPIEAHSLLSDQRTAAIVTPDARVTWMCLPRIDSAAVFAELVGGPVAGYWSVGPASGARPIEQHYGDHDLLLRSTWTRMTVTDYLDVSQGRTKRKAGRSDLIRVLEGSDDAIVEFAPRLDFGRVATRLVPVENGLQVVGTADLLVLRSPGVVWELVDDGVHHTARANIDLRQGPVTLELRCGTANVAAENSSEPERRAESLDFWTSWSRQLDLPSIAPDLVLRSALLLRGLVHGPTGAIVAAATTSLPEHLGGVRNWDYRYCWIRDAALTASSLLHLGSVEEAMGFLDWVTDVAAGHGGPERLAPLYLVTGHHLPPEADISDLAGYAGSRPVRVGNAADRQIQLDVFGPLADLIAQLVAQGAPVSAEHWHLVVGLVDAVRQRWMEPDHGIWEIRAAPRHHTYSRVMCWLTVDAALRVAAGLGCEPGADWHELRQTIADDVDVHGWRDDLSTYTAAYGREDIDASVLSVGLAGMVDPASDRFRATVETVEDVLREGPTVRRYRGDDGLPGKEGGFHLMTSWLIDAYTLVGRRDDAVRLFGELCDLCGATGVLPEEYDPANDRSLGNVPQAYSHLGLINNALRLDGRLGQRGR